MRGRGPGRVANPEPVQEDDRGEEWAGNEGVDGQVEDTVKIAEMGNEAEDALPLAYPLESIF